MSRRRMIDPPSGWKYGFPKEFPEGESYTDLLRRSGYPEEDIDFALQYSRSWTEESDDE